MRLGVFGGTFDPIHIGHLIAAEDARVQLNLDEILLIPTGRPWLKANRNVTDPTHRLRMVQIAIQSNPNFRVSDMEVLRPGSTYTVDTLKAIRSQRSNDDELFLILGMDSLNELGRWHEPAQLFDMATLVGMARPGYGGLDRESLENVRLGVSSEVILLESPLIDISGTELRQRISEGKSIRYRVPEAVESYIREHGLYLGESNQN